MADNWIPIWELFVGNKYVVFPEKLFVGFNADIGSIILPHEQTGTLEDQELITENLGGWHPFWRGQQAIGLVAHNTTIAKLTLSGREGWNNGAKLMKDFAKMCYSSNSMNATGTYPTKAVFMKLKEAYKQNIQNYWIATHSHNDEDLYLLMAKSKKMNIALLKSNNTSLCQVYALRPTVILSTDTLVNIGDEFYNGETAERALKIKLGITPSKEEFKQSWLEVRIREEQIHQEYLEMKKNGTLI